ncbi:phage tail protein, partial [Streptomyces griseorubiginosus]|nr:phage tail protein [Streptomyces griseorubiginosus]
MPHLTSTTAGTTSTGVRTGFGVPGYAHPLV